MNVFICPIYDYEMDNQNEKTLVTVDFRALDKTDGTSNRPDFTRWIIFKSIFLFVRPMGPTNSTTFYMLKAKELLAKNESFQPHNAWVNLDHVRFGIREFYEVSPIISFVGTTSKIHIFEKKKKKKKKILRVLFWVKFYSN